MNLYYINNSMSNKNISSQISFAHLLFTKMTINCLVDTIEKNKHIGLIYIFSKNKQCEDLTTSESFKNQNILFKL